jgi:hypothetical protein
VIFSAVYSDPNGGTDLNGVYLLVNSSVSFTNACYVYYFPQANQLYLRNDGGTAWSSPALTPGVTGTASNSQCTLNAGTTSVTTTGNNLTLNVTVSFSGSFTTSENVYLYATGLTAQNSEWVEEGGWAPTLGSPAAVSLSPTTGTGTSATFTAVYSDANGVADLGQALLLVSSGVTTSGACDVYYNPQTKQLSLGNDAGTGWSTPALTPGAAGTAFNSQCTLNAGTSSVSTAGNSLTLTVALSFSSTFLNAKGVYLYAAGIDGQNSGWVQEGTWTPANGPPAVVSLSPVSGMGNSVALTAVYSDASGMADMNQVLLLLNTGVGNASACEVFYNPQSNQLSLSNDAGTGWLASALTPGGNGTLSNSQCTVNAGSSSATVAGNNLTLGVSLNFSSTFVNPKNVYLYAAGLSGQNSGWVQKGMWTPNISEDVLTWHNDLARTAQNLNETILTPANVNSASFGKLFSLPVGAQVHAQPLYASAVSVPGSGAHNLLILAGENGGVFAYDADTGAPIWNVSTLQSGETPSNALQCNHSITDYGIMATPVIDRTRGPNGAVYLVAMSMNSAGTAHFQRLHALDLATGAELFGGPIDIQATVPGTGDNSSGGYVVFDPKQYHSRPGLLLLDGIVYTSWGSFCDNRPYTGWVIGYDASTLAQTTVFNLTPNGWGAGVWMSGASPAVDASGNIYLAAGNGLLDATETGGFPSNGDYGNALLKLSPSGAGGLAVTDYFDMDNELEENDTDTDLGSGGVLLLPDMIDASNTVRHLAVAAGKDTNLYLVNRDNLGKFVTGENQIYQELAGAFPGGIWSAPAYYNNMLYYESVGQPIVAFQFSQATLLTSPVAQTANVFGYGGGPPSISANGNTNGILWATEETNPAVMHAYDATTLKELYNTNQAAGGRDQFGDGNRFVTPTIAHGKVYVGTMTSVGVFGLLVPGTPAVVSLAPTSGSGTSVTLSAVYSDPSGAGSLSEVLMFMNLTENVANACYVSYQPGLNQLYLYNDAGTGLLTPALTPGVPGIISNSQCTLDAGSSSVTRAGNILTLNAALSFSNTFVGTMSVYLQAKGLGGSSGWSKQGNWTPNPVADPAGQSSLVPLIVPATSIFPTSLMRPSK